jgi:hypothetical protein
MAPTAGGTAWRHLRCGAFVTGGPHGSGPAVAAPLLRRGKELGGGLPRRTCALIASGTPSRPGQRGPPLVLSPVPGRVLARLLLPVIPAHAAPRSSMRPGRQR